MRLNKCISQTFWMLAAMLILGWNQGHAQEPSTLKNALDAASIMSKLQRQTQLKPQVTQPQAAKSSKSSEGAIRGLKSVAVDAKESINIEPSITYDDIWLDRAGVGESAPTDDQVK